MPVCCNRFRVSGSASTARSAVRTPSGSRPNGVSDTLEPAEPFVANPGTVNSDGSPNKPNAGVAYAAGTGGGYGPEGVNGSRVFLPFGLDPNRTPVMGSFDENTVAAKATSAWYQLPPRTPDRPLVTVAAAGAIWYYDEERAFNYGQSLKLQWGVRRPDGSFQALNEVQPIDIIAQKAWRNLRFPLAWAPPEANVARIVADDPNLSEDQWFAFTPPRVPVLQTAQQFLGSQTPVLMDIATAANFPCQRPFSEHLGVAELPEYRILPNLKQVVVSSNMWQSAEDGGPFLFIQALLRTATIPTYLRDDWYRDWGSIERYDRVVPESTGPRRRRRRGLDAGVRLESRRTDQGVAVIGAMKNDVRIARWVATVAGLIGFVLSIATPLLPVVQTTATLNWPQNGQLNNVTAPLISQAPVNLTATVPCEVVRSMPPIGRAGAGYRAGGRQAGRPERNAGERHRHPRRRDRPQRGGGQRAPGPRRFAAMPAHRDHLVGGRHVRHLRRADRRDPARTLRSGFADPNLRPAIVGVFTDLTGPAPPGLSFSATIDTRFSTKPTVLKLTAMVLAIAATVVALVALWRLDQLDGRRMRRVIPARWRTFTATDVDRGRRVPAVACDRRELVGRRLHPRHGPGRRPRRLHVELLPLVRQPGGPVRLVLQPAGADDVRQRRQHLDPAAGSRCGAGVLAAAVP